MAIINTDLDWYLTGASSDGGAQADPDAAFGHYRSSTEITSGSDNNILDDTSGAEATAGDTEYRCICVKNAHGSLALTSAKVLMVATGNAESVISYAVEVPTGSDSAGYAQTIANESTSPTVNSGNCSDWSTATTYATGVAVNIGAHDTELSSGEILFIWIRRVVSAGASAAAAITASWTVQGDTAA